MIERLQRSDLEFVIIVLAINYYRLIIINNRLQVLTSGLKIIGFLAKVNLDEEFEVRLRVLP